ARGPDAVLRAAQATSPARSTPRWRRPALVAATMLAVVCAVVVFSVVTTHEGRRAPFGAPTLGGANMSAPGLAAGAGGRARSASRLPADVTSVPAVSPRV